MQYKKYRVLNILAGAFVFAGGLGVSMYPSMPYQFYFGATCLAIGVVLVAVLGVKRQRELAGKG